MSPNRIAVILTVISGLTTAIAVPVANLDLSSTAGVVGGLLAIVVAVVKWLEGWQLHETRVHYDTHYGPELAPVHPIHGDDEAV